MWQIRKKKAGFKYGNLVPYTIKPGNSILVYQRSYNQDRIFPPGTFVLVMPVDIAVKEAYIDNLDSGQLSYNIQNIEEAFMIGLLLLCTFFNLFFFSVVKEREYIYFALFVFFLPSTGCGIYRMPI